MLRATIVSFALGLGAARAEHSSPIAWPLRATVSDPAGRPVAFHAVALGGELIFPDGPSHIRQLARGDTLSATTPAQFPLDLAHGPVVFFTSGRDSIRVEVGRNPFGADPVSAHGRRISVRLLNGSVVIDRR